MRLVLLGLALGAVVVCGCTDDDDDQSGNEHFQPVAEEYKVVQVPLVTDVQPALPKARRP